jgi:hypothetical protein
MYKFNGIILQKNVPLEKDYLKKCILSLPSALKSINVMVKMQFV